MTTFAWDPALRDWLLKRAAIDPPNQAENMKLPISGGLTTVAPSRFGGRSVSSALVRIPFRWEGSADHFSEACPELLGQIFTSSIQAS
jgi:hypothetical protein